MKRSKSITKSDAVVCVMSGNFVQRGEPAIVNKWARTEMALDSGADLVIEIPCVYALSSAEFFAFGAIKLLDSLGIIDCISFGSENGKLYEIELIAKFLYNESKDYKIYLKSFLDKGHSFPSSREKAIKKCLEGIHNIEFNKIMGSSNNILGIEYLKALNKINSRIVPYTIKRLVNSYNDNYLTGSISSATSIRKHIKEYANSSGRTKLKNTLPESSLEILDKEFLQGRGPVYPQHFENLILAALRRMGTEQIKLLPDVSEGLENRIIYAAEKSSNLNELVTLITTRRYTRTRINRILLYSVLGITDNIFKKFNYYGGPRYIRVLGFNTTGRKLLSAIKKNACLPLITKTAHVTDSCNPLLKKMFEIEKLSTDIYVLAYSNMEHKKAGQDFTRSVIKFKDN